MWWILGVLIFSYILGYISGSHIMMEAWLAHADKRTMMSARGNHYKVQTILMSRKNIKKWGKK